MFTIINRNLCDAFFNNKDYSAHAKSTYPGFIKSTIKGPEYYVRNTLIAKLDIYENVLTIHFDLLKDDRKYIHTLFKNRINYLFCRITYNNYFYTNKTYKIVTGNQNVSLNLSLNNSFYGYIHCSTPIIIDEPLVIPLEDPFFENKIFS